VSPQLGPTRPAPIQAAPLPAPQYAPGLRSAPQVLPGCMEDCAAMGYKRSYCQKNCKY
jgi:hypothetical protein